MEKGCANKNTMKNEIEAKMSSLKSKKNLKKYSKTSF